MRDGGMAGVNSKKSGEMRLNSGRAEKSGGMRDGMSLC